MCNPQYAGGGSGSIGLLAELIAISNPARTPDSCAVPSRDVTGLLVAHTSTLHQSIGAFVFDSACLCMALVSTCDLHPTGTCGGMLGSMQSDRHTTSVSLFAAIVYTLRCSTVRVQNLYVCVCMNFIWVPASPNTTYNMLCPSRGSATPLHTRLCYHFLEIVPVRLDSRKGILPVTLKL
jgi:hypothetical protein